MARRRGEERGAVGGARHLTGFHRLDSNNTIELGIRRSAQYRFLGAPLSYLRAIGNQRLVDRVTSDYQAYRYLRRWLDEEVGNLRGKRLLEIGCGRLAPTTLLLTSAGITTVGIDLVYSNRNRYGLTFLAHSLLSNGPISALRELQLFLTRQVDAYYSQLSAMSGLPIKQTLKQRRLDTRACSVYSLPFADSTFDVVFSNAVFEHISDLNRALKEIKRVLAIGGTTRHAIHLFLSPSGGHNPQWNEPTFEHWDHLLERKRYVPSDLNQFRISDYVSAFARYFGPLEVQKEGKGEGKEWLTPRLLEKLSAYETDELTTSGLVIVAKKTSW